MSRFLKVVVNIILFCSIVVAGGLLIPPFAGVTTVIVDDVDMDTNLAKGSVTYALDADGDIKIGNKVLVNEGESQYVYEVASVNGENYTLEDKLSTDGQTKEMTLGSTAKKVLFTVPFIGYVTMALKTTEGLIIVGLAVVFVIILFILAEIWKKDEEDEEEDDEDEEESQESADGDDEEEPQLSKRQQKKAKKAQKKADKAAAKAAKKAAKKGAKEEEPQEAEEEDGREEEKASVQEESRTSKEDQQLFDETSSSLAAGIADMLGAISGDADETPLYEKKEEISEADSAEITEDEEPEGRRLAMPVYTKDELIEKAKAAGEEPDIVEDESNGITFFDYSDIL